jgi:hypothetical protein
MPEKATVPAMIAKTPRTGGGSRVAGGDERNELALEVAASAVELASRCSDGPLRPTEVGDGGDVAYPSIPRRACLRHDRRAGSGDPTTTA